MKVMLINPWGCDRAPTAPADMDGQGERQDFLEVLGSEANWTPPKTLVLLKRM
jgi:hypothetical protein